MMISGFRKNSVRIKGTCFSRFFFSLSDVIKIALVPGCKLQCSVVLPSVLTDDCIEKKPT